MPKVIPFPNQSQSGLKVCLDSVDALETALKQIGLVIEDCQDSPSKRLLIGQQQIIHVALHHAKTTVAEIAEDLNKRGSDTSRAMRPANSTP